MNEKRAPQGGEFDFDRVVERQGTGSVKWDRYRDTGIIPLWVADMDFAAPLPVLRALEERMKHPVFGYTNAPDALLGVIEAHLREAYGWEVRSDWIVWLPGLVTGLNVACRAVGARGDEVVTATPIYPPFLSAPKLAERELVTVPLKSDADGHYKWDMERLSEAMTPATRLLLLCNPHNPVGRVWSAAELAELARLCEQHDVVICSDDIHAGLVLDEDKRHVPIAIAYPQLADRIITLMAPSKTFNIPGLGFSFAVIADENLRRRFRDAMRGIVPDINVFGYTAALAAYRHGEPWRQALLGYLRNNRAHVVEAVRNHPHLTVSHPEATYLAWIDARGLAGDAQKAFERAGLGPSNGADFGGAGFVRLNFGCRRALLMEALARLPAVE